MTVAPYRIGITGHRVLDDKAVAFLKKTFHNLLQQAQQDHPEGVVALSGLAIGSDTLFAEAALALGIPLEGILAYQGLEEDFDLGELEHYHKLLQQCQAIHQLTFSERSEDAYL